MMQRHPSAELGTLFDFQNGRGFKKIEWRQEGLPIIRIKNLNNADAPFNHFDGEYDEKIEINKGDLLFSWSGTIGSSFGAYIWSNGKGLLNQHIFKVSHGPEIARRYAYHALHWITADVEKGVNGAVGLVHITKAKLKKYKIPLPPLPEQKRIVTILDDTFERIDTAIANTEKNLANARELFESYLNNVFTQKGEGWVDVTVAELVKRDLIEKPQDGNHGEIHPKKADFVQKGVPFVMASGLVDGGVDQRNCNFISREQADGLRKGFAKHDDVLLSHKGTIGRASILSTKHDYVMLTPQVTYYRILDGETLFNRYLYYFFQSPVFQREIGDIAGAGSTRAYIGILKQLTLHVSFPSLEEQKRLASFFDRLVAKTQALEIGYQQKIDALTELKQSILQKAFAGELTADMNHEELVN